MQIIWLAWLKPKDLTGKAPKDYREAPRGADKAAGLYGEGEWEARLSFACEREITGNAADKIVKEVKAKRNISPEAIAAIIQAAVAEKLAV
jgi:hypothetical protein